MDQNLLLTAEKLALNPDLRRGAPLRGVHTIKNVPAQTYLTVSREQDRVLGLFAEARTVPDALGVLVRERDCLPMREFYELIVKAYRAGVLCSGWSRKPIRKACRWPGLRAGVLLWPSVVAAAAALLMLIWKTPPTPADWREIAWGLGAGVAALGLGQALAAALLVGYGGDVYLRPLLGKLAPWLARCDLADRRLLPRRERLLVGLAETLPLSLVLSAALIAWPAAGFALGAIWVLVWRPWGSGMPRRVANLFSRCPNLDTDSGFEFVPNQRPQRHWRAWWRRWDWRVCAVELVVSVGWTLLVARIVLHELGVRFGEVISDRAYWSTMLPCLIAALLITVMVVMVRRWRGGVRSLAKAVRQELGKARRRWRQPPAFPDTEAALQRRAIDHPLFGLLNPYDQGTVMRAWRPANFKSGARLTELGVESGHVGLILSGRASVERFSKSGRRLRPVRLEEGGLFGLPVLRAGEDALPEVRARTPISALMLPAKVFSDVVVARLGADSVHDLTHKYAFLRQLKLCDHWHAHAVARFARLAQLGAYADGEVILKWREEPQWFYIVYEGTVLVRRDKRVVARLRAGEFFGEISLLQNGTSTAEMVAEGVVRCLQIDRTRFLRFVTHNYHVALELERISSARLGRPIFPMEKAKSDVRGLALAGAAAR